MDNFNGFNKDEFAMMLHRAKGDQSISAYAKATNVSAAHISRLLRSLLDSPPSPETISKLSSKAVNEISYRDLMVAAGHIVISNGESDNNYSESNLTIEKNSKFEGAIYRAELNDMLSFVIYSHLNNAPFKWTFKKQERREVTTDMTIDIENSNEEYSKWYVFIRANLDKTSILGWHLDRTYGLISRMKLLPTDKIIIAVNTESYYNGFHKRPPLSLRSNLFIMLIDLDQKKIIKEEKLCDY